MSIRNELLEEILLAVQGGSEGPFLRLETLFNQVIDGPVDFASGFTVKGEDGSIALEYFKYNPTSNRLEATREIETLLSSFFLGNQWSISSSGRGIVFSDISNVINYEPVMGGLKDQSIPANLTMDGVIQPNLIRYGEYVEVEFAGPIGSGSAVSGSPTGPWPADQFFIGFQVRLAETLDPTDWVSYTVRSGSLPTSPEIYQDKRPVTSFPSFNDGDYIDWWMNPPIHADAGDEYWGEFSVLDGGEDAPSRGMVLYNALLIPDAPWGIIRLRDYEHVEVAGIDKLSPDELNTYFASKSGKDENTGKSLEQPFLTIQKGQDSIISESPSQSNQFSLTSTAYGVYAEAGFPVALPDWAHLYMPQSSFAGYATAGSSVVNASSFAASEVYSITAMNAAQSGLLFDGSQSAGVTVRAVTSINSGPAINIINSAANSYPDIGFAAGVVTAVNIDTDTTTTTHCNINIVELSADNATGYSIKAPNGPVVLRGDTIRVASGVTVGKSINVDESFLTTIDYQTIEPDMFFNAGKSSLSAQLVKGDITVELGARLDVTTNLTQEGDLFIFGEFNAVVNGIEYGFQIDNDKYTNNYFRSGNIPGNFDVMGRISLDGDTDTVTNMLLSYQQNTSSSRTVDFKIVDAATGLIDYFTMTNTESVAGVRSTAVFASPTPLPSGMTLLELKVEDNGGQVSDASISLYFTRTP